MSILAENRMSLSEAAKLMGVHVQSVLRWHLKGVKGVKLSTFLIGGTRMTSRERLEAFIAATTAAANGEAAPAAAGPPARRERELAAAEKKYESLAGARQ